jgi:AbrB family looped-hinge helix DNA binding protein
MTTLAVTHEGQITLPQEVREALGLLSNHQVLLHLREDGVVELYPETVDLMSLYGILKPTIRGVTLQAMDEAIGAAAAGE